VGKPRWMGEKLGADEEKRENRRDGGRDDRRGD